MCELIDNRHVLSKEQLVSVEAIDEGDGALRHPCRVSQRLYGVIRPAAAWAIGASDAYIRNHRARLSSGSILTFEQYVSMVSDEDRRKVRRRRKIVVSGFVEIVPEDAAMARGAPPGVFGGYGHVGVFPVQMQVGFVEIVAVLP